jgi:hypothetical protein
VGTLRENIAGESPGAAEFLSPEAAELEREQEMGGVILPVAAAARQKPVAAKISQQFDPHPTVVLGSGPNRPLFISVHSQREIVQALAWKSALYIWGGPILTLFCFWYLLSRFGSQ